MKKFEVLPHKADLKIKAFGGTKEELFLNMLLGMNNSISSPPFLEETAPRSVAKAMARRRQEIKIKSPDLPALLVDFLSEILYQTQINRTIYNQVKFKKFTGLGQAEIEGEISGRKVERFKEEIKAVTYHSLDVSQRKDGIWEATVLFDI